MRSTEDDRCIHPDGATRIDHSYTKVVEVDVPGVYRYQITLHLNDGRTLRSNTADVTVIASH